MDYNPLIIKPIICELHVHVILLANNLWIAVAPYSNQLWCVFNNCFITIQLFVDYGQKRTKHTYCLIDAFSFFIAAVLTEIFCYLFSRQQTCTFQRLLWTKFNPKSRLASWHWRVSHQGGRDCECFGRFTKEAKRFWRWNDDCNARNRWSTARENSF